MLLWILARVGATLHWCNLMNALNANSEILKSICFFTGSAADKTGQSVNNTL